MRFVCFCTFVVIAFYGCVSSTTREPYSHGRHIASDGLKGFMIGLRAVLESRAEVRRETQQRNAIVRNAVAQLGSPDRIASPDGKHIAYFWSEITIENVIGILGVSDDFTSFNLKDSTVKAHVYMWGSYYFVTFSGRPGVVCFSLD